MQTQNPFSVFKAMLLTGALAAYVLGQANTASIRGTVADSSGAVVPHAKILLTNTGTGIQVTDQTNDAGEYVFQFLPPGSYRVETEVNGFKKFVRENIVLDLGRQLRIDVSLEPGQITQTVDVAGQAPLVDTENGSLGTTIQNQMLTSLPNLSRDPTSLQLLSPGVVSTGDGPVTNGGLVRIDPYYIDGLDSSNHVWSGTPVNPNPDVIQEFKTLSNSYSAEYGESSGATLISTTKSGTNQFHGSAFEFLQNDAFNAGDFFAHTVTNLRYNQYGGTFGGPIKRNKTFFFVDAQITRQKSAAALTNLTVPTAAFRNGDFSSLLGPQVGTDTLGQAVYQNEVFDPATQRQVTTASGTTWVRDPFPGNIIPASRISHAATLVQDLYPLPQLAQNFNNYNAFGASTSDVNEWDVKIDHSFTDFDRLTVRYSEHDSTGQQPSAFGYEAGGGPIPGTLGPGNIISGPGRQAVLNYVHIFGPTATNNLMIGWQNQYPQRIVPGWNTVSQNSLGIYGLPDGAEKFGTPYFSFSNFENLGSTTDTLFKEWQTQNTLTDTFSLTSGRHNIRIGGEIRKLLTNNFQPEGQESAWTFNTDFTNQPGIANTGFDYASFLLGLPAAMTYSIFPDYFRSRASVYAAFVQDDFHVSRTLTVNLGLRWDAPTWFHEALNRSGVFDLAEGQYIQFGQNGFRNTPWDNDWHNFNPRLGFAYSPQGNAKFVLRGGYGIFVAGTNSAGAYGFMQTSPFFADSDLGRYTTVDQIHWKTTLDNIPYQPVGTSGRNASSVTVYPNYNPMAYVQQWNLNVQTEMKRILFEIGYVGTRGVHLNYGAYNENAIPINLSPIAQGNFVSPYVPYPQYPQGVTINSWIGSSNYNALQIKMERRFSNGLAFTLSYTHSKMIDTGYVGYRDPVGDRSLDRGLSPYNTPERVVAAYNYQLPFGPGHPWLSKGLLGNVIGGWEINGITTYQAGFSLTPVLTVNNCVCGNSEAVPNVSGNPMTGPQTLNSWFNTSVFSIPAQYTIGNAGRGLITGPDLFDTDVNLAKRFALPWREGMNLEFRAEFFNVFNHPQFSNPDVSLGDANFGKITSANNPRKGQLALKLYF
ncbi:MAG: TonB-dependent receptor [Bryobacteraceae bacterium]